MADSGVNAFRVEEVVAYSVIERTSIDSERTWRMDWMSSGRPVDEEEVPCRRAGPICFGND